ncbi:MAG: nicotinate phosphoribosyltransferase [Actinomycetota bacterium]
MPDRHALLVDLYELTMAASYFARGMNQPATFDLFFRGLPPARNFLVACGLEQALAYLEDLRFEESDLDYLQSLGLFSPAFVDFLAGLRFTGDVWAVAEGEVVFPPAPVLSLTAPLIEAQIVETYLLNRMDYSTAVASKAARVALACGGRSFVDFSARRDHGPDAAVIAARAAWVGGAAATSNVLAGKRFGIPLSGTMAHSYVMAFPDEASAFRAFAREFPDAAILLIDTFDTLEGARTAAGVADELAEAGIRVRGVRIDSGDLAGLSKEVRRILDAAGHPGITILASGDLDENRIADLLARGAPIDGFGVGTRLGTSDDAPSLGAVYKLVEDPSGPKSKRSTGKATLPGRKQVWRTFEGGTPAGDLIAPAGAPGPPGARPLLEQVMAGGVRTGPPDALATVRSRCREAVASLPPPLFALHRAQSVYPVAVAPELRAGP